MVCDWTAVARACLDAASAFQRLAAALDAASEEPTPGCDCSPHARCDRHERDRPKGCTCNGPYASSECPVAQHAAEGRSRPDCDPSLVE